MLTVEPDGEPIDESAMQQVPASVNVLRTPWIDLIKQVKGLCRMGSAPVDSPGQSLLRDPAQSCRDSGPESPHAVKPAAQRSSGIIREFVSRLLITPDSRVGWIRPAVRAAMRHIRRQRPDVLYSTSPYASAHLIGLIVSRRTGLPWVADFRDPWRDNPFRRRGPAILERWDAWLERTVLRRASYVVCNTPTMAARLCRRLPFLTGKCSTILNGFDQQRFEAIEPARLAPGDTFVLTHSGQFYGPRSPNTLFTALRSVLERRPDLAARMQVMLIGPRTYDGRDLGELAAEAGVAEQVKVLGQKRHAETLSYLAGSDALLLVGNRGGGDELQVPNKLFEYLAMRKPIIAAVAAHSPAVSILSAARAQALVCDPGDPVALAGAVAQLAQGRPPCVDDAWGGVARFDRIHRAAELADIFRKVSAGYLQEPVAAHAVPEGRTKVGVPSMFDSLGVEGPCTT